MTDLSVNLNKIALIRNSRVTAIPDLVEHAGICLDAGADGITVHPRPDQRHIRAQDCYELAPFLRSREVEFNIEGNPFAGPRASGYDHVGDYSGFMTLVRDIRPAQCTLVPDGDAQLTSDHGFNIDDSGEQLKPILEELKSLGVRSSLFMDPDPVQIRKAADIGADRIELYTGPYADAVLEDEGADEVFEQFYRAAEVAAECGLGINAGHDLNLVNLPRFASIPQLLEVSIGHALTVDALSMGLSAAVKAYQRCLGKAC